MPHTPDINTYLDGHHILPIHRCLYCGTYTSTIHKCRLKPDAGDGYFLEGFCKSCADNNRPDPYARA